MQKTKKINIGQLLPLQTVFESSIIEYWENDRNGKINLQLLEKIKLANNGKK